MKHCVDMESARVTTGNRVSVAKAMSPRIGGFANVVCETQKESIDSFWVANK